MAPDADFLVAVTENLVHMRITTLLFWLRVFLFHCGWSQVGHSQYHGPPEVVIPLRITDHGRGMNPPDKLTYSLHFGGQRHIVHMKVKKIFLARHMPIFTYTDQGALLEDQPFVRNDCYYHGYVDWDPESLVALSTCFGGFRGILQIDDITYEIEPKNLSTIFEHLIYKLDSEETHSPLMGCALTDEEISWQLKLQETVNSSLKQSSYEGWWTHSHIVELAVVVDHVRYLHHQSNTTKVHEEVCLVLNLVDEYFVPLDVDLVFKGLEIWTTGNPVSTDNIRTLLSEFTNWKKASFGIRLPHDTGHVFVKKDFGVYLGLAYVGTACKYQSNSGVDSFLNGTHFGFANTVAHEIGHNMGMLHDEKECKCATKKCIMYPFKTTSTKYSNCSYSEFWNYVVKTRCLFNMPNPESIYKRIRCGNKVVEDGEMCDCGSLNVCAKDPCCESNCTFTTGSVCAFGLCCKDCQFMPSGTVCREQENQCDLPEFCNGTSYDCPEDVYVQAGSACSGDGYCYQKRCNNRDAQCRKIFGKEAKNAKRICYQHMNEGGDRFGHCGFIGSTYSKCYSNDILCGRVQCEDVTQIPLLTDHNTVHWINLNGVTCWSTDYHFGMTIPDIGEVKDGTECGFEHICMKRECVHMARLSNVCSPVTCNMSGICNNKHHCHCNENWSPPNCQDPGFGGSIDSGPAPPRTKDPLKKEYEEAKTYVSYMWIFRLLLFILSILILIIMKLIKTEDSKKTILKNKQKVSMSEMEEKQNVLI